VRAPAGSFAHLPGGTVHGFRIESEKARYLILTTPRHGQFYRAITLASRAGGLPPLDSIEGPQIEQASEDYGVEFVGHCQIEPISSEGSSECSVPALAGKAKLRFGRIAK
jgi:hypothetical protein